MSYRFDVQGGTVQMSVDGGSASVVKEEPEEVVLRAEGGALTLRFSHRPGHRLVGLGERFGRLDYTGRRWEATIVDLLAGDPEDTYYYAPFVLCSAGYAVLLDTYGRCLWDLAATRPDEWTVTIPHGDVEIRIFRCAPARAVELATAVMGRAPLAPPWMFGVWKTTLSGSEQVLRHAERLGAEQMPVTACWVYDHYDEATNSGCGLSGTYPSGEYPDLPKLISGVHDLGYRILGYTQPCMYAASRPFEEAESKGFLVHGPDGGPAMIPYFNPKLSDTISFGKPEEGGAYVDLTNPEAVSWYRDLIAATADQGWDGWMQDMGEHLPLDARMADGTTGSDSRNRYPLLYHRACHEATADREGFGVFARSGTLGSTQHVEAVWPGDQTCDWLPARGLPSVLTAGPTVGLLGVGCWGPDIVGIVDGPNGGPEGGLDEELWLRWCAYGALNPIMRDHLGFKLMAGDPIDLWSTERTRRVFRDYAILHLSLFPYLYAAARACSETGVPTVRALLLEYPEYDEAWTIADQYLLGDALLVAPVHRKGATSREVWFPPGEWVDWWDGARYSGPSTRTVPAPLERIPLFQRAGTSIELLRDPSGRLDDAVNAPTVTRRA